MAPYLKRAFLALGLIIILQVGLSPDLSAFSVSDNKIFAEGPYAFKLEIQVSGKGSLKKAPNSISALKVKIKNERASSEVLKVKSIRVFQESSVYRDIETREFTIAPGQWVTKYYRLSKRPKPILSEKGFIEVTFGNFIIRFYPREKKFQGPIK